MKTDQRKEVALAALVLRRKQNKNRISIDNSKLYAGSPMYFECVSCRDDIVVPENYITRPELCGECQALKKCGWLE